MARLQALMGLRRQQQIEAALKSYTKRAPGDNSRKLTTEQVRAIRQQAGQGETVSALARKFGVSRTTIRSVRDRASKSAARPAVSAFR